MIESLKQPTVVQASYGTASMELSLPAGTAVLRPREPQPHITPERFRHRLGRYLAQASLDLTDPVLVVTDKTRRCDYPDYLPITTSLINHARGSDRPFPIIIAYGTHPRQSEEESRRCYGRIYQQWPFIHHDCDQLADFSDRGTTAHGTPIRLRRDLLGASAIITMGPICHHYFAGYGGGRKLIFPGCGERWAIYHNHGLFLDRTRQQLCSRCRPGNLENNPLADDLFAIESMLPAHLALHGLQDSRGRICDFLLGAGTELFRDACCRHGAAYEIDTAPYDTVIASCGGFPKDINIIQAHKALHHAAGFVRDGGRLIVFAACRDGIGSPTFLPWFSGNDFDAAFARLAERYEGNGGTALAMLAKTRRIRMALVTELDQATCTLIGLEKWSVAQVREALAGGCGRTGWIGNASLLVNRRHS